MSVQRVIGLGAQLTFVSRIHAACVEVCVVRTDVSVVISLIHPSGEVVDVARPTVVNLVVRAFRRLISKIRRLIVITMVMVVVMQRLIRRVATAAVVIVI